MVNFIMPSLFPNVHDWKGMFRNCCAICFTFKAENWTENDKHEVPVRVFRLQLTHSLVLRACKDRQFSTRTNVFDWEISRNGLV